ncbi:hypothetical protein PSEUBRA_004977 [Kalmanozyma brasiliensis GHG001]|uniref:Uncharacterized protein n=1 Tax=Kalmanozyma brasiliensis (strain GHG001) TaxID=1365824 RepID=V5ESJ0_KALBG|nr:uncharacterized protein PSEUBRA_004977 [Kalmanozyma brasiliensis GHG001]EST05928.1 hypothetical protein PSEUBRA_004977 [Kalmanozyma brasiliensis GHG001]
MSHAAAPLSINTNCGSKKRKAFEEASSMDDYSIRPKLSLPRSAGLVFNGEAQFHPLPADVNAAMLAQMGQSPFASAGSSAASSSSGFGHAHKSSAGSDYFPTHYPDVEPYPAAATGILGPSTSTGDMDIDTGSTGSSPSSNRHGPHCKSIPQLCVRYNDGAGSELWATCPDCGTCSKVESNQPSRLCYSP